VVFGGSDSVAMPDRVLNWDYFEGALLAVGFRDATGFSVLGSAVIIAPGLAVSATHVFMDRIDDLAGGECSGLCVGIRTGGVDLWNIRKISLDPTDDLTFLSLELASPIGDGWAFSRVPVTTRCPRNGEFVTIIGFRFPEGWGPESNGVLNPPPLTGDLFAAAGEVTAVFYPQRDSVMLPFPVIEIQCGSLGAMSGGAVIDSAGHLLGVISSGLDSETGGGPTYASWIMKGLGRSLEIPWPPGVYREGVAVVDLPDGVIALEGREAFIGDGPSRRYKTWFGEP
jgi:hypothetical protein